MEAQRLVLLVVFSLSVFFLFEAWQKQEQVSNKAGQQKEVTATTPTPVPGDALRSSQTPAQEPSAPAAVRQTGKIVTARTDYLIAEIDTLGGTLRRLELLRHRSTDDQKQNFVLLQSRPDHLYLAQSGLIGVGLPNHQSEYTVVEGPNQLSEGEDSLAIRLAAPNTGDINVTKIFTFHRSSYVIDVRYEIANASNAAIKPFAYYQLVRDDTAAAGDSVLVPTYTGAAVFTDKEKFHKVPFEDFGKVGAHEQNSTDGWIAMIQHYFVAAWLPPNGAQREFYTKRLDGNLFAAGLILPIGEIEPQNQAAISTPLYVGPQESARLAALAPGLDLTIDYGWLTVIASPLFWVLAQIQKVVVNWGVAIIILTILIKLMFYPLSAASYRSMAKMRVVTPRLQKLKEQYGDDRQRMHQAMMELYKTEKINPLGGCLPVVVQIPVFIALYWVLLASVQLRHAPFALWIQDLSAPDPYFVLPVLMGLTMIIQSRLNPVPPDPIQAKVMKIMPIAFSVFFFFFPAGLVLYWLVNNILSIAQQWYITRDVEQSKSVTSARAKR
ncbi:MAG: membrane protein insertase YidC [Burkholderiales bacterium]|nr:membrane protein insertase YidC [Pseudomonadota bacterium]